MKSKQPFLQIEKKQGGLRLTLGPSFGHTLVALAVLLTISFSVSRGTGSLEQWTTFVKAAVVAAKSIIP